MPQMQPMNWILILIFSFMILWMNLSYTYFVYKSYNINKKNIYNKPSNLFNIKW